MRFFGSAMLIVLVATSLAAAIPVVDFEDWVAGPGPDVGVSRDFVFSGMFSVYPDATSNNSSNSLHSARVVKLHSIPGLFDLYSLDVQEGSGPTGTMLVRLVGELAGGESRTESFYLDGNTATFETFRPTGFAGVEQLFIYAFGSQGGYANSFAIDNMVVPEPGVLSVVLLGLMGVWRRSQNVPFDQDQEIV